MTERLSEVDALAQEIRRVDGNHDLGAGALAEALMPFLAARLAPIEALADRAWAERFLREWSKPHFGPDANDAVACVRRAALAASRPAHRCCDGSECIAPDLSARPAHPAGEVGDSGRLG